MSRRVPIPYAPGRMPDVLKGEIFQNAGKYARGAVVYAFEQIGGPDGLAQWANDNPDDFYTKLFPKIIARESEVHHVKTMDDLMEVLDGDYEVVDGGDPQPLNFDAEPHQVDFGTADPIAVVEHIGEDWGGFDLVEFEE